MLVPSNLSQSLSSNVFVTSRQCRAIAAVALGDSELSEIVDTPYNAARPLCGACKWFHCKDTFVF